MNFALIIACMVAIAAEPRDFTGLPRAAPEKIETKPIEPPIEIDPSGCRCGCGSPTCRCGRGPGEAGDLHGLLRCVKIEWDDQSMRNAAATVAAAMEAAEPELPQVQIELWHAEWCKPCKPIVDSVRSYFERTKSKNGKPLWEVSPTPMARIRLMDFDLMQDEAKARDIKLLPTVVFLVDGIEVERKTAFPGREYLAARYNELARANERSHPKAPPPAVAAINAGQITFNKEWIPLIRSVAAVLKGITFKNGEIEQQYGDGGIKLPPLFGIDFQLTPDKLRFVPTRQPVFKYGRWLSQPLEAITLTDQSLTLELPGLLAPDFVLRFKK